LPWWGLLVVLAPDGVAVMLLQILDSGSDETAARASLAPMSFLFG
jgi:hypothetical protein